MRSASTAIAKAISAALNAPLVTLYTFLYALIMLQPLNLAPLILITTVFGTILPMGIILFMLRKGIIKDVYASNRETRLKPFLAAVVSYFLGLLALFMAGAPLLISVLMAGYLVNTVIMMLITLRWKISIHASGVAGPATYLVYIFGIQLLPLFLLIIPVGWSRLELKAHSLSQVLAGFFLTVILTYLQLYLYLG